MILPTLQRLGVEVETGQAWCPSVQGWRCRRSATYHTYRTRDDQLAHIIMLAPVQAWRCWTSSTCCTCGTRAAQSADIIILCGLSCRLGGVGHQQPALLVAQGAALPEACGQAAAQHTPHPPHGNHGGPEAHYRSPPNAALVGAEWQRRSGMASQ